MRRHLHGSALVAALLLIAVPASLSGQRIQRRIFVTAIDRLGVPVLNLTPSDFVVDENGAKKELTRAALGTGPMRIVLFVDTSSAMSQLLNNFRGGLAAFLEALPGEHEITLISTGGQLRIRAQPTADRTKLREAAGMLASDGGANAFMDSLIEADRRFMKTAPAQWPVFVILTTDNGETRGEPNIDQFNRFVNDFIARGGSAHAIVVSGKFRGITSDLAMNLVENTGGFYEAIAIANVLPDKMKAIAAHIGANHKAMATWYELEFPSDAKLQQPRVQVGVAREGVTVQMSARRPF